MVEERTNRKPEPVVVGFIGEKTSGPIAVDFNPENNPRDNARRFLIGGFITAILLLIFGGSGGDSEVICCSGLICTGGLLGGIISEFSYMKMLNQWRKEHAMKAKISPFLVCIAGFLGFLVFVIFLDVIGI